MSSTSDLKKVYKVIDELGEEYIKQQIIKGATSKVIHELVSKLDKIEFMVPLLHYLLTLTTIPSQRKITKKGIQIDIVIPDLKTLETKPEQAIIVCILKDHTRIKKMEEIQPITQNIWYVTELEIPQKKYSIKDNTITRLIQDIEDFLPSKIFRFVK